MILSSIKTKLIFLYSTIMLTVLSVLSVILFLSLQEIVYKPIDSNLTAKAKSLDSLIRNNSFKVSFSDINGNRFSFSFSDNRLWIYSSKYSKYFFQIRSLNGQTLGKSISLGKISIPFHKGFKRFENIRFKGKILRLLNFVDKKDGLIIQIAYNIEGENSILDNFTLIMFLSIIFIMISSALGGFIVSSRALKPINDISDKIKKISKESLSERIDIKDVPAELEVLVSSFNDMLKRLDKSFKQQKRFISDISHELKTPISIIMMQSDVVLKKERMKQEYQKAIESIKETTLIMSNLIEKMLMIARLDSKYNKMSFEDITINDVVKEAVSLFKRSADKKGIKIKFKDKKPYTIKGDRITLLEVFINLIDNAVKYNKENGKITIEIGGEKDFTVVCIEDSGIGIPEEKLRKITEEFYRADESRSKETKGFGLGLSIVKRIVELHNGEMAIESTLNTSTKVKIFIPSK